MLNLKSRDEFLIELRRKQVRPLGAVDTKAT
jgi:hypothetical protein